MTGDVPGWYVDAMEQNLGMLVMQQRERGLSVQELVELLLDPSTSDGRTLDFQEHLRTLAICVAIAVRRLARVDMPT